MSTSIRLQIQGMHCGGCVRRVGASLAGVDGADDVKVEVGSVVFVSDDDDAQAIADEAKAAVVALGFEVTAVNVGDVVGA